uniref:Large ribosomal subunit protein uL10 n=1 Tax=Microcebus murinus TaxID=30608 RepID=A0A8C5XGV0_MICMU
MPREDRATWNSNYFLKIILDDYPKCFMVGAENVGKVVALGKNNTMCKAIQGHLETNPPLEELLLHIQGNVGFMFTKEDLTGIRDVLLANKVPAATHACAVAPCEVIVPSQNTDLGPEKTSFFQVLGITTEISRDTIEILTDVFDNGSIYCPEVLEITGGTLHCRFLEGVCNVASVRLQIGYPAVASVPHSIISGYKRVLALSVETDYTFPLAEKVKAFFTDPSAFVAASLVATATTAAPAAAVAPTRVEAKEELEVLDEDTEFGLFD